MRVGAHRAEHHRDQRAGRGDDEAVPDRPDVAVAEEHEEIVELRRRRIPGRRELEDLARRLQRDGEHPVDREEEDDRDRDRGRVPAGRRRAAASAALAHRAISIRRSASDRGAPREQDDQHDDDGADVARVELLEAADYRRRSRWSRSRCPGPPRVSCQTMSKRRIRSSPRIRSAIIITGQIAGRVTLRNACQRAGAVDRGGVELLAVDVGERREQDDEHERRPLPDVADDDRRIGPGGLDGPQDRDVLAQRSSR